MQDGCQREAQEYALHDDLAEKCDANDGNAGGL